jgi:TPR repeat protein
MKRIFIILFGVLLFAASGAQTLMDSAVYNKGLRMIESSKSYQDFEKAGNYFDVLTNRKKDEWLAPLYSALSFILASFREPDTKLKETLCDKAQIYIDTSGMRHPDISELASMQAFLYQARIDVSPMERGLEYSLKADSEIKKAEAANPGDPRAYFLYAMNVYYTPKIFGGGPGKALPHFEQAAEKFNEFVPKMSFMPHWGKQQNLDMIAKCRKEEKD